MEAPGGALEMRGSWARWPRQRRLLRGPPRGVLPILWMPLEAPRGGLPGKTSAGFPAGPRPDAAGIPSRTPSAAPRRCEENGSWRAHSSTLNGAKTMTRKFCQRMELMQFVRAAKVKCNV